MGGRIHGRWLVALWLGLVCLVGEPAGLASAQADGDDDIARRHFELGRTYHQSGRFAEAAQEFQRAFDLSGRPQLLYNISMAKRDGGDLSGAVEALDRYLREAGELKDRARLEARLRTMQEQLAREQQPAEEPAPSAEGEPGPPESEQEPESPEPEASAQASPMRKRAAWGLLGAGGGLLLASIGTGVVALGRDADLADQCSGGVCDESLQGDVDSGRRLATATDVLWIAGTAAAVTGLVLWLTGTREEVPAQQASLACDARGCSAAWTERF